MQGVQHAFFQNISPEITWEKTFALSIGLTAVVLGILAILGAQHLAQVGALSQMPTSVQVLLITGGFGVSALLFSQKEGSPPILALVVQGEPEMPLVIFRPPLRQTHPHLVNCEKLQAKDSFMHLPAPFLHALAPFLDPASMANVAGVSREGNYVVGAMRVAVAANDQYWDVAFAHRGAKRIPESEGELPPQYRYQTLPKPQSVLDVD